MLSKKATQIWQNWLVLLLVYYVTSEENWEILSNFCGLLRMVSSEYINFLKCFLKISWKHRGMKIKMILQKWSYPFVLNADLRIILTSNLIHCCMSNFITLQICPLYNNVLLQSFESWLEYLTDPWSYLTGCLWNNYGLLIRFVCWWNSGLCEWNRQLGKFWTKVFSFHLKPY